MLASVVAVREVTGSQIIQDHFLAMLDCGDTVHLDKRPKDGDTVNCQHCRARVLGGLPMPAWVRLQRIVEFTADLVD